MNPKTNKNSQMSKEKITQEVIPFFKHSLDEDGRAAYIIHDNDLSLLILRLSALFDEETLKAYKTGYSDGYDCSKIDNPRQ